MVNWLGRLDKSCFEEDSILIFPDTFYKFEKTDGYIEYCKFVLENLLDDCKNEDFKNNIKELFEVMSVLKDDNVRFNGNSKEDFESYVKEVSKIYENITPNDISLDIIKLEGKENILNELENYAKSRKNHYCFFYDNEEDMKANFKKELLKTLNGIDLVKNKTGSCYDISYYLTSNHYHEHIHDAINAIISTLIYAFNCYSFSHKESLFEDEMYIKRNIDFVKSSIERIEYVK